MDSRIKNILRELKQNKLDGLIVTSPCNISYLTKYPSRDSFLLVSKNKTVFFTDFRYFQEAKRRLGTYISIEKISGPIFETIAKNCIELKLKHLGFEDKSLSFYGYSRLIKYLGRKAKLIPANGIIEEFRQIKGKEEILLIRKAIDINILALQFIRNHVRAGKTELQIVAELERFIRYKGALKAAFDIIVAAGPNSSFPHHMPSQRKIKKNEPVLIDIGVEHSGYKSDLTRVFFSGKIDALVHNIYEIVRKAQESAINKVGPGIKAQEIDKASRDVITDQGYAECFGHSLGHGVGLEIHEAPKISPRAEVKLKPGMVFTIEPAIYLPGKFGIRLEDVVLVTRKGCEVLSGSLNK